MKLILIILLTISAPAFSQSVTRDKQGNFYAKNIVKSASQTAAKLTTNIYTDSKGVTYPVYISKNGKYFVKRISAKSGKEYNYYLKVN